MANNNQNQDKAPNGTPNTKGSSSASSKSAKPAPVASENMHDQASGMIALDVESFANGFMQIMLSGIGWASGEIAKTDGANGSDELKTFTAALSTDLPEIISKINAAANGTLPPAESSNSKKGLFGG